LLLVLALVACQFGLVLHQLDLEQHAGGGECKICLACHALDHGLATLPTGMTVEAAVVPPGVLPADHATSRTPVRQVARSPPAFTLHA
jgi:hypothetical protein